MLAASKPPLGYPTIQLLPISFWVSNQACSWVWHSAPTEIDIDAIRSIRVAIDHGMTVLVANDVQLAALEGNVGKQCKANRNGTMLNAYATFASEYALQKKINKEGGVYLAKNPRYNRKHLFTANRAYIVPPNMDWRACVPAGLRGRELAVSRWSKKIVFATKAAFLAGFGLTLHRFPRDSATLIMIGCLHLMHLFDTTPILVIKKTVAILGINLVELVGADDTVFLSRQVESAFIWLMVGAIGLWYVWKDFQKWSSRNGRGDISDIKERLVESKD